MRPEIGVLLSSLLICTPAVAGAADSEGLIAHWGFDAGKGDVLADLTGNGNDGAIHGATWVKRDDGFALQFDGLDDYVDCGDGPTLGLTEALTIEAWIKPLALPGAEPLVIGKHYDSFGITHYRDGQFWYYISGGGNNAKGRAELDVWSHIVATFDGERMRMYVNRELTTDTVSKFQRIAPGGNFLMALMKANPTATDPGYGPTSFWHGEIDNARVYNRALTETEVLEHYKAEAAGFGIDTTWFDHVRITAHQMPADTRILGMFDVGGVFPRPETVTIEASLWAAGAAEPIRTQMLTAGSRARMLTAYFDAAGLTPGEYQLRATTDIGDGNTITGDCSFAFPEPRHMPPAPAAFRTDALPAAPEVPDFDVQMAPGGGFTIALNGHSLPFESCFSFPNGGENRLTPGEPEAAGEPEWQVSVQSPRPYRHLVSAKGKYYSVERTVRVLRGRVAVEDTITNTGNADVGIIVSNHLDTSADPFLQRTVAGYPTTEERAYPQSPSSYVSWADCGVGVLPLDDLYVIQAISFAADDRVGTRSEKFALPPGASHTLEWAAYPTSTPDYYEFLNRVRHDEGRIGTVEGGFDFIDQTPPVTPEEVAIRNTLYASFGCMCNVADDPEIEIEGIEFVWLPRERARIRERFEAIRKLNPQLKLMFHIAHSLVTTNKPNEMFPDSRVIDANGKHLIWEYDYMNTAYFTRQRAEEGYRWYIYYPTPGNSFHDALMKAADLLTDEIGAGGAFMDGFHFGYVSPWTYDRWDGRSAEINLETKTIDRKVGSVLWMSQPSMVAFTQKLLDKGAVVVANNVVQTRTVSSLPIIIDQECRSGPDVHLAQTPCALGNPSVISNEADVYTDVLDKLRWGNLYFYYGEPTLTYPSLPQQQYPITVEELHAGTLVGRERIITMNSGAYGWPDGRKLHYCYRYSRNGVPVQPDFVTTVDAAGVRTQVDLEQRESAVVKWVPIELKCAGPVNVVLTRYDAAGCALVLNGDGEATLTLSDGDFAVTPGAEYRVTINGAPQTLTAGTDGALSVGLRLRGLTEVAIERVEG